MFGGENNGASNSSKIRGILNDIMLFDVRNFAIRDQMVISNVSGRKNHCGFMIGDNLYSIGGVKKDDVIINEFLEIDVIQRTSKKATVNKGEVPATYNSAIVPVFYQSKMGYNGDLQQKNIVGEIDWGDALDLIMHEGFYHFGGLNKNK